MSKPVFWPSANPVVTEEAGTRGGSHNGIDLAAFLGDPVIAAFDGVAVFVGGDGASGAIDLGGGNWLKPNGEGRTVDIRRADGLISRVGHLEGYAIKQGDTVKAGQVIGYAGNSGYSTGVHIHWELRWDRAWSGGAWINPRTVNPKTYAATSVAVDTYEEEDDEMKPTVHVRTEGGTEYMRAAPEIGKKLKPGTKRADGSVTVFRGYEVTTNANIGIAWARTHTRGAGHETSRTNRAGYLEIQRQAQRLSVEMYG